MIDDVDRFFQCDLWNGGGWSIHSCEPSRASPGPHLHQFFQLVLPMAGLVFAASCCWFQVDIIDVPHTPHLQEVFARLRFQQCLVRTGRHDDIFMWHVHVARLQPETGLKVLSTSGNVGLLFWAILVYVLRVGRWGTLIVNQDKMQVSFYGFKENAAL